jgi:tetratricopeptide (TPR) repeat protein
MDYEKSLEYHQKALQIRLKVCGNSHADLADSHEGLGITLKNLGKEEEALKHFQEAFSILEKIYRKDHFQLIVLKKQIDELTLNKK